MLGFAEDLWNSVFTPGTTPTLIIATHATFALLIASLSAFIFISNFNIHLINLLVIALLLWATLTWFISELDKSKAELKSNEELTKEEEEPKLEAEGSEVKTTTSVAKSTQPSKRKTRKL